MLWLAIGPGRRSTLSSLTYGDIPKTEIIHLKIWGVDVTMSIVTPEPLLRSHDHIRGVLGTVLPS